MSNGRRSHRFLLGKRATPARPGAAVGFLEGVLWIARTGAPWRDLPVEFDHWNFVFKRFRRRIKNGVLERVFSTLSVDADFESVMADGTIVRFQLMAGQRGEMTSIAASIEGQRLKTFLADKAYDADWLRNVLRGRRSKPSSRRG